MHAGCLCWSSGERSVALDVILALTKMSLLGIQGWGLVEVAPDSTRGTVLLAEV